jgi:hypothetical protein
MNGSRLHIAIFESFPYDLKAVKDSGSSAVLETGALVIFHLRERSPQAGTPIFGLLMQSLELPAVSVREGGGVGKAEFDERPA